MATLLPNVVFAGAQKSGCTSLYTYLTCHPEVRFTDPDPEMAYFCTGNYRGEADRYRARFAGVSTSPAAVRWIGEATPGYLFCENAPARMKEVLGPDLRLVFILRNPASRTISAYWHTFKQYAETRDLRQALTFGDLELEQAIAEERERIERALRGGTIKIEPRWKRWYDDPLWIFRYVENSAYLRHLQRFAQEFSREQLHVVLLEQMVANPEEAVRGVERFLGIDENYLPPDLGRVYNKTLLPKDGGRRSILHSLANSDVVRRTLGRSDMLKNLYRKNLMAEKPKGDDEEVRQGLMKLFAAENSRLGEFLGVDLTPLWK